MTAIEKKKPIRKHNPQTGTPTEVRLMYRSRAFRHPGLALGVVNIPVQGLMDYHVHEDFSEIVLVTSGSGEHEIGGKRYPIRAGDIFLVSGNQSHCYTDGRGLSLINVAYNWNDLKIPEYDIGEIAAFQSLFVISPDDPGSTAHCFHLNSDDFNLVLKLIRELDDILQMPSRSGMKFLAVCRFGELVARILEAYEKTADSKVTSGIPHRLGALVAMLERHYYEPISIERMCRFANMSYASLFRHFKRWYHDSPVNYLLKQRLLHAEEMLSDHPELSVGEIAFRCGFSDSVYFSRKFSELYHIPPSRWRKQQRHARKQSEK